MTEQNNTIVGTAIVLGIAGVFTIAAAIMIHSNNSKEEKASSLNPFPGLSKKETNRKKMNHATIQVYDISF